MNLFFFASVFLLFLATTLIELVQSLIVNGRISTNKDWVFLAKFCFVSRESQIVFNLNYPDSFLTQTLLLYYDFQWAKVYPMPDMSCQAKKNVMDSAQHLILSVNESSLDCDYNQANKEITCSDRRGFITARPRWWFLVISRCHSTGISLNYNLQFYNGASVFRRHFSADEFGIFEATIAFTLFYLILVALCHIFGVLLYKKKFLHVTFKLFLASVILEFVAFLLYMIEYAQFSQTGNFLPAMLTTSRVFDAIAQIIFLLMLILVAKGYTITRGKLRKVTVMKITIFFIFYIVAYAITFIYAEVAFDPGLVNYFYSSPPGIVIIGLKLVFGWVWFLYSTIFTIKNFPEKRAFFICLLIFFTIWFFIGPLIILFSGLLIQDHTRQSIAYITQSAIISVGHLFFLILVRPWPRNNMFPYHVRTNQIGIVGEVHSAGSSKRVLEDTAEDTQNYPHHLEGKGGNVNFEDMTLREIFTSANRDKLYMVSEDAASGGGAAESSESRDI